MVVGDLLGLWAKHAALSPRDRRREGNKAVNGGHVASVQVSETLPYGRGLALTKDVMAGETILSIPPSMLVNTKTMAVLFPEHTRRQLLPASRVTASKRDTFSLEPLSPSSSALTLPLTSIQCLSLLLACAMLCPKEAANACCREHTPECQALECLLAFQSSAPRSFATHPLWWRVESEDDHATVSTRRRNRALLDALPTEALDAVQELATKMDADYKVVEHIVRCPSSMRPVFVPTDCQLSLGRLEFTAIWLSISTRSLFYPLNCRSHDDNVTLAPLLDMANHTSIIDRVCPASTVGQQQQQQQQQRSQRSRATPGGSNVDLLAPIPGAGSMELRAPLGSGSSSGLAKGQEVCIQYGARDDCVLLTTYGFHSSGAASDDPQSGWSGNPCASLSLDEYILAHLHAMSPDVGSRWESTLRDAGYWREWTVHPSLDGPGGRASFRTEIACRLLAVRSAVEPLPAGDLSAEPSSRHSRKRPRSNKDVNSGPSKPQPSAEEDLRRFDMMLAGRLSTISASNEAAATELLKNFCRQALVDLQSRQASLRTSQVASRDCDEDPPSNDQRESLELVDTLLSSLISIAQRMQNIQI
ncbi:unnamed protein product [Parajaminaea phylloscopi]